MTNDWMSSLITSGEKLHTRLARVEELQGRRGQRTYVFMPKHAEMKPVEFAEGEAPERGDVIIAFEPLHATAEEAVLTVEEFRERFCQRADLAPVSLPGKSVFERADPPVYGAPELELTDESYPKAEFASSTTGTLLIRVLRHAGDCPKPRPATDADREAWPTTFQKFIEACLARRDMVSE